MSEEVLAVYFQFIFETLTNGRIDYQNELEKRLVMGPRPGTRQICLFGSLAFSEIEMFENQEAHSIVKVG